MPSPIAGHKGNREFLLLARLAEPGSVVEPASLAALLE